MRGSVRKNGIMKGRKEDFAMKTVMFELKIIHKKRLAVAAENRGRIDEILQSFLAEGAGAEMENARLVGILAEETGEHDCSGECEDCPDFCPEREECMAGSVTDVCRGCEYQCTACGNCRLKGGGGLSVFGG